MSIVIRVLHFLGSVGRTKKPCISPLGVRSLILSRIASEGLSLKPNLMKLSKQTCTNPTVCTEIIAALLTQMG